MQLGELSAKIRALEKQLEEAEGRETQVRANNKVHLRFIMLCYLPDLISRRCEKNFGKCSRLQHYWSGNATLD